MDARSKQCFLFGPPGVAMPNQFSCSIEQLQFSIKDFRKRPQIIGLLEITTGVELQLSSHWDKELLWLWHGDSSGTQRKGNVRRRKPLPENWWRKRADREDSVGALVNCRAVWTGESSTLNCNWVGSVQQIQTPNVYSHTTQIVIILYNN
jgi:hypothetical protein